MTIGEILKIKRAESNLTQKELADMVGAGQTTIANYESGFRTPSIEQLNKICKAMNISIVAFLADGYDFIGNYSESDIIELANELEAKRLDDKFFKVNNLFAQSTLDFTKEDLLKQIGREMATIDKDDLWVIYSTIRTITSKKQTS